MAKATESKGEESTAKPAKKAERSPAECVVDDGTPHFGRAVPGGRVCSRHEVHYYRDGTPRAGRDVAS